MIFKAVTDIAVPVPSPGELFNLLLAI